MEGAEEGVVDVEGVSNHLRLCLFCWEYLLMLYIGVPRADAHADDDVQAQLQGAYSHRVIHAAVALPFAYVAVLFVHKVHEHNVKHRNGWMIIQPS